MKTTPNIHHEPGRSFIESDCVHTNNKASTNPDSDAGTKWAFVFLWLFTVAVFARPEDLLKASSHFELVFGSTAAMAYVFALVSRRTQLMWSRELTLIFLITVWFTIGVGFAFWKTGSFDVLTQVWLKVLLIFFLLTQTLTNVGRIRKILWAIIFSELVVTAISILASGDHSAHVGERLAGVNGNLLGWNYLGIAVAMMLPYIAAQYVARVSLVRSALLLATVGSSMWMLVLTASRGGFLGVILSTLLTWWFILSRCRRGKVVGVFVLVCLAVVIAKAPDVFWSRLQTVWSWSGDDSNETATSANESAQGRKILLVKSIGYTFQYPVFGVGLGNFKVAMGTENPKDLGWFTTHNTFTQVSSEGGIPALLIFVLFLAAAIRHMGQLGQRQERHFQYQEVRLLAWATFVSIISFAFEGLFASVAYDYFVYYPAGIAVALWSIYQRDRGASTLSLERSGPIVEQPFLRCSSAWR